MKSDKLYLVYILECKDRIEAYTVGGEEVFLSDEKTQDAVLRNLHTLSESVQRISEPLKKSTPNIDWRDISALRNVVVHDYFGIDLDQIWNIVKQDIPNRKDGFRSILANLESRDKGTTVRND